MIERLYVCVSMSECKDKDACMNMYNTCMYSVHVHVHVWINCSQLSSTINPNRALIQIYSTAYGGWPEWVATYM